MNKYLKFVKKLKREKLGIDGVVNLCFIFDKVWQGAYLIKKTTPIYDSVGDKIGICVDLSDADSNIENATIVLPDKHSFGDISLSAIKIKKNDSNYFEPNFLLLKNLKLKIY